MVVADNEINEFEVEVLERYLPVEQNEEIHAQKQLIFSDDENQPGLSSLLYDLKLTNFTTQQKNEIVRLLADVAYGDDYMSSQEKTLLYYVAKSLNVDPTPMLNDAEKVSKERIRAVRLSNTQRFIGQAENLIYKFIPGKKSNSTIDFLLGSLGYSTVIEKITDNAIVDLDRVSKIVDGINASLNVTEQSLNNLKFEKKIAQKRLWKLQKLFLKLKTILIV